MKRYIPIILFILLSVSVKSQSLSVESFKLLENDLTANTRGTMKYDQNGDVAALIKVVTTEKDFNFDVGTMGVVATSQQKGEIWVYVPAGVQRITISHAQLGVLRDYYFPEPIEKARTYELKLTTGSVRTIVEQAITSQYVVFKVNPSNSIVYIDDDDARTLDTDGMLSIRLSKGRHTYRISASSYLPDSGAFTVEDEKITKEISLKSAKAKLTVKTVSDAEIWINDKKMSTGTWTGDLIAGVYLIEARKESHITSKHEITLEQLEQKTITLADPIPLYGSLDINSTPLESSVYLDGKNVGETPLLLAKVLIGNHSLLIKKDGYEEKRIPVNIEESRTNEVNIQLDAEKVAETNNDADIKDDIMTSIEDLIDWEGQSDIDSVDIESETDENIYMLVEDAPEFPGGTQALLDYLRKNLKYPAICRENNIQGRVLVSFIVEKDGSISNPEVVKNVNSSLDKEALRLISAMPKWKPGSQRGKPVRVKYTVPVNFRLN